MGWRERFSGLQGWVRISTAQDPDSRSEALETELPRQQMLSMIVTQFFQGVQITLPFTMSAFMVRRFQGEHASEQVIGQLTGFLAAAAPFSRFLSSFPWGYISDYSGRKAVILLSNGTAILGILAFGASTTFVQALLARIIPAMLNGCAVALKSMLGESCDATNQARGMALFTLGWGFGTIVGPLLGGLLAEPCDAYGEAFPLCGSSGVFRVRPYLPPCLSSAALGVVAFTTNVVLMEETLPSLAGPGNLLVKYSRLRNSKSDFPAATGIELPLAKEPASSKHTDIESKDAIVDAGRIKQLLSQQELEVQHSPKQLSTDMAQEPTSGKHASASSSNPESAAEIDGTDSRRRESAEGHAHAKQADHVPLEAATAHAEDARLLEACGQEERIDRDVTEAQQKWYRNKPILKAVVGSALVAFSWNFLDELTPIFVSAPVKQGGLGLSLERFTYPIIFGGVVLVVYSLALYPAYQKRVGPLHSCKVGLRGGIPAAVLIPLASLFGFSWIAQAGVLCVAMGVKGVFKIMSMTSSMVLINIVAPKARMGAVNGAAMALSSLARALGPALSGSIWALVVTMRFPGQQFVGFTLMGIAAWATSFLYSHMKLPAGR